MSVRGLRFRAWPQDHPAGAFHAHSGRCNAVCQGDNGDAFYVVRTGEASVHVENEEGKKQVATLKAALSL